jgi:hypothetical protein
MQNAEHAWKSALKMPLSLQGDFSDPNVVNHNTLLATVCPLTTILRGNNEHISNSEQSQNPN